MNAPGGHEFYQVERQIILDVKRGLRNFSNDDDFDIYHKESRVSISCFTLPGC